LHQFFLCHSRNFKTSFRNLYHLLAMPYDFLIHRVMIVKFRNKVWVGLNIRINSPGKPGQ